MPLVGGGPILARPAQSRLQVRKASADEIVPVAALLVRAFATDPIEAWCMACADPTRVMEVEFLQLARELSAEGWLWVTDDLSAVAAWLLPGADYGASIDAVVNPVLAGLGGDPERLVRFWEWVDRHRPTTPHWYLDLVAVDTGCRGHGRGRLLLEHGLARTDELGGTTFLVTGNPSTVPWYERHGFVVGSEQAAPDGGPRVWFMLRAPSASHAVPT